MRYSLWLGVSDCDQRGLYGDCAYDGPVVRVGSLVGRAGQTSRLSPICSISNFTCYRALAGPISSSLACQPLVSDRQPGRIGFMRSSTTAIRLSADGTT